MAPSIAPAGPFSVEAGSVLSFEIRASDPEGAPITLTAGVTPAGSVFVKHSCASVEVRWNRMEPSSVSAGCARRMRFKPCSTFLRKKDSAMPRR